MKMKKIGAWVVCIVTLLATMLSPLATVAASVVENAKAANQYDELAQLTELLQAANKCMDKATSGIIVDLSTTAGRDSLKNRYNLNVKYGDGSAATIHSNYLESLGVGQQTAANGSVSCTQLNNGINIVPKLLTLLGLYTVPDAENIVCGRNNEGGLFTIKTGYKNATGTIGDWWTNTDFTKDDKYDWPEGWPDINKDGSTTDCKKALSKIKYYTETDTNAKAPLNFQVQFVVNKDYDFSNYVRDALGDSSSVSAKVLQSDKYLNFQIACNPTKYGTKREYDNAKSSGVANLYEVYHNGTVEYYSLPSPSQVVYASGDVASSTSTTCKTIAESLSPSSSDMSQIIESDKLLKVNACYSSAQDNITNIKKVHTNIDYAVGMADSLLINARNALTAYSREIAENNYSNSVRAFARNAGGG